MKEESIYQALLGSVGLYTYWVLYILTGIACAYYVYQDAIKPPRRAINIHPYWWAIFAPLGGVWTVFPYWVMQHSALVKSGDK
jgi:hypothetical protein